jgi:LysR family transcriptional regulator, benzoate and cis,cis-muconate-responsive activator of ben and cat genes
MMFRSLRYFVAVYEELSFSAASKRCFVAQPSISAAVNQLETELGCTLFVRHAKGVTPTPSGSALYPKAFKVLADIGDIKGLFKEGEETIPLQLALSPFLGSERVSVIVKTLIDSVVGLELELVDVSEPCDARIISTTQATDEEVFQKLWTDNYVLALSKNHPLTALKEIPFESLDNVSFISRQPCDIDDAWRFAVQNKGVSLATRATVKTEEYALDLVAAGLGVSIVPSYTTSKREDIVTRPLADIELERVIGFAYPKKHALSSDILKAVHQAKLIMD